MPHVPFVTALPHRLLITLAMLVSIDAQALTLGRIQGAALIGRPLDVSVQVQLDANQSLSSACFEADVFHADTRQNPTGVRLRLEPTTTPHNARLRITSDSQIDEPIVTVYVRAGCAQMSSRRYVLLADIVSEQAEPVPRVTSVPLVDPSSSSSSASGAGNASSASAVRPAVSSPGAETGAVQRPTVAARQTAPVVSEPRRAARAPAKRAVAATPAAPAARNERRAGADTRADGRSAAPGSAGARGSGQSRLQLDPLEMLSERVATLESNATASPAQVSEREAREAERLERLEASVNALLALAQKNEASLLDVRSRLEKAQADRVSNTVIYALVGMLLLSLLAIAYLLARINRGPEASGSRWFDADARTSDPDSIPPAPPVRAMPGVQAPAAEPDAPRDSGAAPLSGTVAQTDRQPIEPTRPTQPAQPTQALPRDGVVGGAAAGSGNAQVDVSLVEMSESTFDRLMQSGAAHNAIRRSHETVPMAVSGDAASPAVAAPPSRARIDADELVDVRQRAEFFVTLGQTDQAVQVLEARIAQDAGSCPQVHLDLLKLFHALGLKADFSQLRDDFMRIFNARVPDFDGFDDEGRSIEEYPGAVDRLIRVWRRPAALETLEALLFLRPMSDDGDEPFDLAAFRDLLMLHAVAQVVRSGNAGSSGGFMAPPVAAGHEAGQVDIDLSELQESAAPTPTLAFPQVDGIEPVGQRADVDLEVPADVDDAVAGPDAGSAAPSDNLIDFDLSDIDRLDTKPGKQP
ncbi:hypothetical protein O4H66_20090 [Comamonadaceae bacterium G21597-S1]|nr:hypothetical protein [Comamonadaceae bacterium G21597-S1]